MWFAALGSYQNNPWFISLIYRLLQVNGVGDLDSQGSETSFLLVLIRIQVNTWNFSLSFKGTVQLDFASSSVKGTVPRDFLPQLFFMKHISLGP
jgi:hypothetical protein